MREGPAAGHRSQGCLVKSDTWWECRFWDGRTQLCALQSLISTLPGKDPLSAGMCATTEELKVRVKAVLAGQGTLPSLTFMSCVMGCTGTMVGGSWLFGSRAHGKRTFILSRTG